MKKSTLLLTACLFNLVVLSQSIKKDYYDYRKTQIMAEYQVNSVGEKHGWFKGYNQEGVLVYEYNYKNNLQDGLNKEYTVYGVRTLSQSETYKAGVLNGAAIYYAGTGSTKGRFIKAQGSYKNGEREGDWVLMETFDSYGYSDEVKKGAQFTKGTFRYIGGEIVYPDGVFKAHYYPSGKTYIIGSYFNGKPTGDHVWYNPDGTVSHQRHFDTAEEIKLKEEKGKIEAEEAKIRRQLEKEKRDKALIIANNTLDSNKVEKAIELYKNTGVNTEYLEFFLVLKQKYENGIIELGTTSITYDKHGDIDNTMGTQLVRQLSNNYLRQNTLKTHEDYCLRYIEIKKLEILEIEKVNKEVQDSFKSYINGNVKEVKTTLRDATTGEIITNKTYLKNKIIYAKSMIVFEGYMELFNDTKSVIKKQETGKRLINSINALNQIPESDWKDLSKQLKKIDDPEQIKTILKI